MTDADHDLILTQIRNQLTTPLPIGTDHPPRQENPAMSDLTDCTRDLGNEIARVRHGDDCTASDLAERLSPWLAEHDRQVKAEALREASDAVRAALSNEVGGHTSTYSVRTWLSHEADRIEKGDTND